MINTVSNIPAPSSPLLLPNGSLSPAWFQFFVALFDRTGGGQGVDIDALRTALETLVAENVALTKQVTDLVAELSDFKAKYIPVGFTHATASGVKRKIAYYEDQ